MSHERSVGSHFDRNERIPPNLLLVEDDETDVLFVQRCIAQHGNKLNLLVARDGAEALNILQDREPEHRPYVVLTDLNMPGVSGFELIKCIRSDERLKRSVIYVLSSSCLVGDIDEAYDFSIAGYINKQVAPEELRSTLIKLLDHCLDLHFPT